MAFGNSGRAPSFIEGLLEGAPVVRVRTATDALPGGWALSMFPLLVDWSKSSPGHADGDFYLVRFVNAGGNPFEGVTQLVSTRVPCTGVERAEFVLVPIKMFGLDNVGAHAQIRIVFARDRQPVLMTHAGEPLAQDPRIEDLIFSWEAWRPPAQRFRSFRGLDPETYGLSVRCYSGAQRFLEDALRGAAWTCYPLELPNETGALDELLYTCLLLGDSLARHFLSQMLGALEMLVARPREAEQPNKLQSWAELRALLDEEPPEDPVAQMLGGEFSYQLLTRSCITMALTAIDLTMARWHERHGREPWGNLPVTPKEIPDWMRDFAKMNVRGIVERLPSAIWWLAKHHTVIPTHSWEILEKAGLLQKKDGHVVKHEYSLATVSPYGSIERNLMA